MAEDEKGPLFTEKLLLRLPEELMAAVKVTARAMGKTTNEYVRDALRAYLPGKNRGQGQ